MIRAPKGPENSVISGSFDVLDDELRPDPIRVVLLNQNMGNLYSSPKAVNRGQFSVTTSGRVTLCVQNGIVDEASAASSFNDGKQRNVGIDVQVNPSEPAETLNFWVARVRTNLWNMKTHQDYMRAREGQHRQVTEQTFSYLLGTVIVEVMTVVSIAVAQVWYLKRLFDAKTLRRW